MQALLSKLTHNAVAEKRFRDAANYYRLVSSFGTGVIIEEA
jgi:hypothetical protein